MERLAQREYGNAQTRAVNHIALNIVHDLESLGAGHGDALEKSDAGVTAYGMQFLRIELSVVKNHVAAHLHELGRFLFRRHTRHQVVNPFGDTDRGVFVFNVFGLQTHGRTQATTGQYKR